MARTYGKLKAEVWEAGSDFRRLTLAAQWAYVMLISQPDTEMCGVLDYAPRKWARLASGTSVEDVEDLIGELEAERYVIVDRETDELLIRSFIAHDRPWRLPNLLTSARTRFAAIESDQIRAYLAQRHEWLQKGSSMGFEAIEEYEEHARSDARDHAHSDAREDVRSDVRSDTRSTRARANADARGRSPIPNPSPNRRGEGVGEYAARDASPEGGSARGGSGDEETGRIGVRAECPVCGPLHDVGTGFSLADHVANVHDQDLKELLASRTSGEAA